MFLSLRALFPQLSASIFTVRKGSPGTCLFPPQPLLHYLLELTILFPMYISHFKSPRVQVIHFYHNLIPTKLTCISHTSSKLLAYFQCDSVPVLAKYPVLPTLSLNDPFTVSFKWKSGSVLKTSFLTSLSIGSSLSLPKALSPQAWKWNKFYCSPCPFQISLFPLHSKNPKFELSLSAAPPFLLTSTEFWVVLPLNIMIFTPSSLPLSPVVPLKSWLHLWWFKIA